MKRWLSRRGWQAVVVTAALGTAGLTAGSTAFASSASSQAPSTCVSKPTSPTRVGHISGIVRAMPSKACASAKSAARAGQTANGDPPLVWHGGAVMGTKLTGPLVVTPIFWDPAGHTMSASYKNIITNYLKDVAAASGAPTNVFSLLPQYTGTDGRVQYKIKVGTPVNDTHPLPPDGCVVASTDTSGIYSDNSGYNACLDDAQVVAQTDFVVSALHMPRNFSHIYVMFTPKHVESCFFPGPTDTAANACTINFQPSAAYCAYHSQAASSTIYANMPYPVYESSTGFTCGSDSRFPTIESPNHNADADTEISPTSHEINESITDPDTVSGWYDNFIFENGDECAYIYGPTHGTAGHLFNQAINGHRYLTQEEFSNNSFFSSGGGCLQHA
jgi:hypothetical protein